MDSEAHDEGTLVGLFIGFVIGTILFGFTILQASQYYLRFASDSLFCKLKVGTVCAFDIAHFVFSASVFYAFASMNPSTLDSNNSVNMDWGLKALSTTQTLLIVLVQIMYLQRIHTLFSVPVLNTETFIRIMNVVICSIGACAIGVGAAFGYRVLSISVTPMAASNDDLSWVIYVGFGSAAALDTVIAALTCFTLHKNRREIGLGYISRRSNRLLLSLFTYSLATGILTALAATIVIILYLERPTTVDYLSVNFITTKLYTNSLLSFVQNVRRQLNKQDTAETVGFKIPTEMAFRRPSASMRYPLDVEASIPQAAGKWNKSPPLLVSGSDLESNIKSQNLNVYSPYSPYYSPLQARKRQIQELKEMRGTHYFSLSSLNAWFKGPMDRRSSL